ncbi:MAG: YcxB family protein [Bacteroidetes bacterium]|nr:YcxB family protein [Bacteroidota bacterium]MBS1756205.1 YcxB family protein [Bacteroidota bacterium]
MEIISEVSKKDYIDFLKFLFFRKKLSRVISLIAIMALLLGGFKYGEYLFTKKVYFIQVLICFSLMALAYFLFYLLQVLKCQKGIRNNTTKTGYRKFTVVQNGISIETKDQKDFYRWENIKSVVKEDDYIYFTIVNGKTYFINKSAFPSLEDENNFYESLQPKGAQSGGLNQHRRGRHIYNWGFLGFIPIVGAFSGAVLIWRGIYQYKDRMLVLIGLFGILFTVGIYSLMSYQLYSKSGDEDMAFFAHQNLNDVVKSIEIYKSETGSYPDSLKQVLSKDPFLFIYDSYLVRANKDNHQEFHYKKIGNKYTLFSVGLDLMPYTGDDIYPDIITDTSKFGLVKEK